MIRFQWNALRAGDHVRVHRDGGGVLQDGTVAFVDVLKDSNGMKGSNGIGIRTTGADGLDEVRWPSRLSVHSPTGAVEDPCGHCD